METPDEYCECEGCCQKFFKDNMHQHDEYEGRWCASCWDFDALQNLKLERRELLQFAYRGY